MATRYPNSHRGVSGPLIGLGVLFSIGLVTTYVLFVRVRFGQRVDGAALAGRSFVPDGFVEDAWTVLDAISVVSLAAAIVVIAVIGIGRAQSLLALAAVVVIVGANVTTQILKRAVFERPDLDLVGPLNLNTLPSGHATVALSVVAGLLIVLPARGRIVVALSGWVYATVVGVSTVTAGWHRPSDVIAAFFVVGVWAVVGLGLMAWMHSGNAAPRRDWRATTGAFAGVGIAVTIALVLLAALSWLGLTEVVAWVEDGPLSVGRRTVAYGAAAMGIAAVAAAVLGLFTTALSEVSRQEDGA